MNTVRISGYLVTPVEVRTLKTGLTAATASLQFSRACGPVILFAIDARKRQLTQFQQGDWLKVDGSLAMHPVSREFAVLIDVCHRWRAPASTEEDRK